MDRLLFLAIAAALASCAPDVPPPAPKRTVPVIPVPEPQNPISAPPPTAMRLPEVRKPEPASEEPEKKVYRVNLSLPVQPPQEMPAERQTHLPAFIFRTMNHASVEVYVNGDRLANTSCLWSISSDIQFDRKIPITDWPPPGAKFAGTTKRMTDNGPGVAELWIASGERVRAGAPHLQEGEHVLYVKGSLSGCEILGALRLYVGKPSLPYRFTDYHPIMDMESEEASRLQRTLWFELAREE